MGNSNGQYMFVKGQPGGQGDPNVHDSNCANVSNCVDRTIKEAANPVYAHLPQ